MYVGQERKKARSEILVAKSGGSIEGYCIVEIDLWPGPQTGESEEGYLNETKCLTFI